MCARDGRPVYNRSLRSLAAAGLALVWLGLAAAPARAESLSDKRNRIEYERRQQRFQDLYGEERLKEAAAQAKDALDYAESVFGPKHPIVADALTNLALVNEQLNRIDATEPLLRRALAIREAALGPGDPETAKTIGNLGRFHRFHKRYAEAEAAFRKALGILEAALEPDDLRLASALHDLSSVLVDQERLAEAEPLLRRELAIWDAKMGPDHPLLIFVLDNYASVARRLGDEQRALFLERRAARVRELRDETIKKLDLQPSED